ncbi:MAG: sulfotransferase [Parvularculaceae bacterium]|nr:sulfotransferase [Parvularculaceae bacterium]
MTTGPIFIGGAPRSGLTLLRAILDGHPGISCGPDTGHTALTLTSADFETTLGALHEAHFFLSRDTVRESFAAAIAAPMRKRASLQGKRRWADKSAFNVLVFERLALLFPDAHFIHLVRDGRDVAASLLERKWRATSGALFEQCASANGAARYWAHLVAAGLKAEVAATIAPRILRVRYEDLVSDPVASVRLLCSFLGEAFDPAMIEIDRRRMGLAGLERETADRLEKPLNLSAAGRWRRDLRPADAAAIFIAHRPLFQHFGYQIA